ncbi:MAG: anti-sigma F factor [Clostridia bacterium]|nr:anti-sigma F factor [Clostridia bacterium]
MNKRGLAANTQNELKISFPSLSINEGIARSAVAAFATQLDPTIDELADIKCAVSEAVTNCIVHAYRDCIGVITINLRICADNLLRMEIKDRGCGIPDVEAARVPLYTTDPAGERSGMGFAVMESFTDRMRVRSTVGKGTVVVLYKKLSCRE